MSVILVDWEELYEAANLATSPMTRGGRISLLSRYLDSYRAMVASGIQAECEAHFRALNSLSILTYWGPVRINSPLSV
jgi:hypothetical protein